MPIECTWWDHNPYDDPNRIVTGQLMVGMCWYVNMERPHLGNRGLSKYYLESVASIRPPIVVMLPTRQGGQITFCVDGHPTGEPNGAWAVGVVMETLVHDHQPDITVAPSINCVGSYHGYLQHGVITGDLEA